MVEDRITSQADFSVSPDGKYLAYTWPFGGGWELRLLAIETPNTSILLTQSLGLPLAPAFSHDGGWIYFTESNDAERTELKRISVNGGPVEILTFNQFDWGVPTGRLVIRSEINGEIAPVRLNRHRLGLAPDPESGRSPGIVEWTLNVHSALPYESVEIFVNGTAVQTLEGGLKSGSKSYTGSVEAPVGGWITARVLGSNSGWPAMDSYLFAESSPVWFGAVGSTDPAAMRHSAGQLLMVLDVSEQELKEGYGEIPIPNLLEHFSLARKQLQSLMAD